MIFARTCLLLSMLCCSTLLFAQKLNSISTRWNDSFVEWEIFTTLPPDPDAAEDDPKANASLDEEKTGELKQRWLNVRDDWSEWDYQLGDEQGVVKVKWKDNPGEWELRSFDGHIISMRTTFPRNFTEWRVTDNDISLNIKSKYTTQLDEWLVEDATHGKFHLYTMRPQDPRDWAIEDTLDAQVSQSFKIALMFIAIFSSVPRV